MRSKWIVCTLTATVLLTGCVIEGPGPGHGVPPGQVRRQMNPSGPKPIPPGQLKKMAPRPAVVVAPALPALVVLDVEPFYFYGGFHYHLDGGVWFFSKDKGGPWTKLPKDRYPKDVKFKGKGKGKKK